MNPQRIVAGLAALAIGFGVTLVGVALADDEGDTIATVESGEPWSSTVENGSEAEADDEAEQDEAPAVPPPAAEVIDEDDVPNATSNGDTTPREGGVDPEVDDPTLDLECERVLVVRTGSGQLLILSSKTGEFSESGGRFFFADTDELIGDRFQTPEIAVISGIIDDRFGSTRTVEDCGTGQVLEATIPLDLVGIEPDDGEATPGDVGDEPVTGVRTTSSRVRTRRSSVFLDELDGLEETELISDADVFIRVARQAPRTFRWDIRRPSGRSTSSSDSMASSTSRTASTRSTGVFVDDAGNGFFCASANVSTDARLFEFFDEVVPDRMTACAYEQKEGVN